MDKVLLIKIPARLDALAVRRIRAALSTGGLPLDVDVCVAVELDASYVYCRTRDNDLPALEIARARAATVCPGGSRTVSLDGMLHLRSEPHEAHAPWHYIVETDVAPESEQDFNDWYTREHMPGLAAVPGTVRADRYLCKDGTPRYYACYDLITRETLGSPPWLAVRGTHWSSRVRPAFRNTKRTMFARLCD
ncbi:DUF4286 family protein [Bordetella sp. FB-8]|uniref:DUF4286 family protein n=1 Tax=Bordetella sp. FB-8 TaxID=1159870 RepID=UPI000365A0AF|nr:DUF4286 family protein [Bordetella sp. FB-8]